MEQKLFLPGGQESFSNEKIELLFSMNSGIFNYNGVIS